MLNGAEHSLLRLRCLESKAGTVVPTGTLGLPLGRARASPNTRRHGPRGAGGARGAGETRVPRLPSTCAVAGWLGLQGGCASGVDLGGSCGTVIQLVHGDRVPVAECPSLSSTVLGGIECCFQGQVRGGRQQWTSEQAVGLVLPAAETGWEGLRQGLQWVPRAVRAEPGRR